MSKKYALVYDDRLLLFRSGLGWSCVKGSIEMNTALEKIGLCPAMSSASGTVTVTEVYEELRIMDASVQE